MADHGQWKRADRIRGAVAGRSRSAAGWYLLAAFTGLCLTPLAHADSTSGLTLAEQADLLFLNPFDTSPNGDASLVTDVEPASSPISQLIDTDLTGPGGADAFLGDLQSNTELAFFNDYNDEISAIEGAISDADQTVQAVDSTISATTGVISLSGDIADAF